jgi:hypothetical protein
MAGAVKVFSNDPLDSFVPSRNHDTPAQDAGKYYTVISSLSAFQLLFSVGSLKLTLLFLFYDMSSEGIWQRVFAFI